MGRLDASCLPALALCAGPVLAQEAAIPAQDVMPGKDQAWYT